MNPYEERENDIPEWEQQGEKIPESLQKKWQKEESVGLRAEVCKTCGWPYTKEDLSCRHCGKPTEISDGVLVSIRRWFVKTWFGIFVFIIIILGLFLMLIR